MESLLQEALSNIKCSDTSGTLERRPGHHHLMHADAVMGRGIVLGDTVTQPVGVQHRTLRHQSEPFAAVDLDVGQSASQNQSAAMPAMDPPDRLRWRRPPKGAVLELRWLRTRKEIDYPLTDRHRPSSWTTTTMGSGEGLVQVHVDDVKAHIAGTNHAQDGVEVRAVVVEQSTDLVNLGRDLCDVFFEEPCRIGVRQHDPRHIRVECSPQGIEVDETSLIGRDRRDLVAAEGRRGGVGAVGRVRNEHSSATIAVGFVIRSHEQEARELASRPSGGLQGRRRHAGDLTQCIFEFNHQLEPSLDHAGGGGGMDIGEPRHCRDHVANLGVVLHGA